MTSLEITELTGKQHNHLMRDIRKMELAWMDVTGRKFALRMKINELANGVKIETPYYSLTKTECLYIATKFNDEARAKLVLRRERLEQNPNETPTRWLMLGWAMAIHECGTDGGGLPVDATWMGTYFTVKLNDCRSASREEVPYRI